MFLTGIDDGKEVIGFERCASNETSVNIGLRKEFIGIFGIAASSVKDRGVVCRFFSIAGRNGCADELMHFFSLGRGCRFAGADCPYRFIGNDDVGELFCTEVEQPVFQLRLDNIPIAT